MTILFQTPSAGSPQLLTQLSQAAHGASAAGAAFAYATKDGIELLFADPAIRLFAESSPFDLIVGLDGITDLRSIGALERATAKFPQLTVSLFLNPQPGRTFHPKIVWFQHGNSGATVTGSGNLTKGGLLRNWEAFSAETHDAASITGLIAQWATWKSDHAADLRDLADQAARDRAVRNRWVARAVRKAAKLPPTMAAQLIATVVAPTVADDAPFLATELIANRLTQPNIRKIDFQDYFGVPLPEGKDLTLYRVYSDGSFSEPHTTAAFRTAPSNFRFNMQAMKGVVNPGNTRPVALFERLDPDTFKYLVLLPGDSGYALMQTRLGGPSAGGANSLRARLTLDELEQIWPDCPLLD